ncbi:MULTISPECIES: hypothetical protein [Sorangium]|uniref:hypothetical protein n=1 Tax=Sorangium TaxID=39643 RepID=UPI003D9BFF2A
MSWWKTDAIYKFAKDNKIQSPQPGAPGGMSTSAATQVTADPQVALLSSGKM